MVTKKNILYSHRKIVYCFVDRTIVCEGSSDLQWFAHRLVRTFAELNTVRLGVCGMVRKLSNLYTD